MTDVQDDPAAFLRRRSVVEMGALDRARALADDGTLRELAGPFDRVESPWLEPQGVVPQADDGVVVGRGTVGGAPAVVVSIAGGFQGGAVGEVGGAKIAGVLRRAAAASVAGTPTAAVLVFETGGVRLQEANLGLNAVAEICSAVLDLRPHAPVVGVVTGPVGSFGGVSIAAGLCTRLVVTTGARLGLNGPAVIEEEAGPEEFDSSDRRLVWAVTGARARLAVGLVDDLVDDDADALRAAVRDAVAAGPGEPGTHRSERIDVLAGRLATLDPAGPPPSDELVRRWGGAYEPPPGSPTTGQNGADGDGAPSRGRAWLDALAGGSRPVTGSVRRADTGDATYLAVVPDPDSRFPRARRGEVGLDECRALAEVVREITGDGRPIVAVVDVRSQAYGRVEEIAGLHQAIATLVDAWHAARAAGHPLVTLVVGSAISGGFLAFGLQGTQLLALADDGVEIHAMHKPAAARITRRTEQQLDDLARTVLPLSYDVRDWNRLGLCDDLLTVSDADHPTGDDVAAVRAAIGAAVRRAGEVPADLTGRLSGEQRAASRRVESTLDAEWGG